MSQTRQAKRPAKVRSVPIAATPLANEHAFESKAILPILLVLFVGSGCAGLIYEIVWFQMLRLVIGSSAVSIAVLLGTFMGGMCLGSLILPRMIAVHRHPLRVYAALELAIGLCGLLLYWLIPLIGHLYTGFLGHGQASILFRGLICVVCLLPPTMLMGATLPAIARWVETTPRGVSRLGFFYGANIAGAVFGCLLAGFWLLRLTDSLVTTWVAVGINCMVGGLALALALLADHKVTDDANDAASVAPEKAPHAWIIYLTIGLSGMTALGAEVVWTRLLSLLLGATTYTFSIILAVFLVGLGIGSSAGAALSKRMSSPRIGLAICQGLLAVTIAWGAYMISGSLPWWPIDPGFAVSSWSTFQLDIVRCAWAMLPAAVLWGASFPLALASVAARGQDPGRLVGGVYAANTLGAIVGALGFSMVMIGGSGTQFSQQLMVMLTAGTAILVLLPNVIRAAAELLAIKPAAEPVPDPSSRLLGNIGVIALMLAACVPVGMFLFQKDKDGLLDTIVPAPPQGLIAYGRTLAYEQANYGLPKFIYSGEGMNASIAVSEYEDGGQTFRNFHVSGKVVASSIPQDMRLQLMLGHIPAMLHPDPKRVLIVGCGAGVTAGTFALYPDIEEIVICEIEPLIPDAADEYFAKENNHIKQDPRLTIVYDDARHYIATTDKKFDIITSDPIHPWVKGAAALYSTEYHALCQEKLNPGGIITLWVPLYESSEAAVKSELASFFHVFDDATIWSNDQDGEGYDVVAMSGIKHIDLDQLQSRIDAFRDVFFEETKARNPDLTRDEIRALQPFPVINRITDFPNVPASVRQMHTYHALGVAATFAGRGSDISRWLSDAELNTDSNMRLQYLAGESLNQQDGAQIYYGMIQDLKYAEDFFSSSDPETLDVLRRVY